MKYWKVKSIFLAITFFQMVASITTNVITMQNNPNSSKQDKLVTSKASMISKHPIILLRGIPNSSMKDGISFTSPWKKSLRRHQRHRRSFGTKTICIPVQMRKCKVFTYRGISKNFCVTYTQHTCTALD